MLVSVTPPKLKFDSTGEQQTLTLSVKGSMPGLIYNASHNLPNCFSLKGFSERITVPVKVITTHTPCSNDCFSKSLFLQIRNVKVPVEFKSIPSLECKICLGQFQEDVKGLTPRILTSCGHTVCEDCAKKLLKDSKITCPFDRKITTITNDGIGDLQKNFTLLEVIQEKQKIEMKDTIQQKEDNVIIQIKKQNDGSTNKTIVQKNESRDGSIEHPCFENQSHEAIYYCEQCDADLCEKCFIQVHTPKILSQHKKLPVSEKPIKLPKCEKHPYNNAEFICKEPNCENKGDLMCHTCILSKEHKSHQYEMLMEELKENEISLKELSKKLEKSTEKLKLKVEEIQECVQSFDTNGQAFRDVVQQITKEFDAKKDKAIEDLTKFTSDLKKITEKKRDDLEEEIQNVQVLKLEIQSKLERKTDFRNVKEILNDGNVICEILDRNDEESLSLDQYTFQLSDKMTLKINLDQ